MLGYYADGIEIDNPRVGWDLVGFFGNFQFIWGTRPFSYG
jgi:hypothetical protein